MHRTIGDGYIVDGGKNVYADEDLGSGRDATQVRHQEMNAFQEEIANVIESEGASLNSPSESIASMTQLNGAINNKLKTDRIANQSSVPGSTATAALNSLKSVNDTQQSTLSAHGSSIAALQGDVGTVVGGDLQTQVSAEKTRNDGQDVDIAALQSQISTLDPASAVKGDAFIFDTADSKWHPDSTRNYRSRIQVAAVNDGLAASWTTAPYAKFTFTGIQINLKGRYATPGDGGVPQGNTLFQTYVIPTGDIEEWQVTALYRGYDWRIRGSFVFTLPASISNGYGGYTTNVFQALHVQFTGASQNLWYGTLSYSQHDGCGRSQAPYKRFANVADNVRYAGDANGHYICTPRTNGIWLGDDDHWFYEFTRADGRTMPGIFTPSRKYAISFDVQAPGYPNVVANP